MNHSNMILASGSPRRIDMLRQNGIEPQIIPPQVEEHLPAGLSLSQSVMYLALLKGLAVEKSLSAERILNHPLILAADTVVYAETILGKPRDRDDAISMLSSLRNRSHQVATGVSILRAGTSERRVFCEVTTVAFRDFSDAELEAYVDTEEPYDKAGGYAIQGAFGVYIERVIGDRDNVIGFPFRRIMETIKRDFGEW